MAPPKLQRGSTIGKFTINSREVKTVDFEKVIAGKDALSDFAPKFAELNDDILFGQVRLREQQLLPRDRSFITVAALMTSDIVDSSFEHHLRTAKKNGIVKEEKKSKITVYRIEEF